MTPNDSIEIEAASIEEAISQALDQLGAQQDDVSIEVLSTPRSGVLGIGSRQARVRVSRNTSAGASSGVSSPPSSISRRPESASGRERPSQPSAAPTARETHPPRERDIERELPPRARRSERVADAESDEREEHDADSGDSTRQSADLAEQAGEARTMLHQVLELMGEKAEVVQVGAGDDGIELEIKGDGSGILIGRHGQTLDALEYVVNRLVARKIKDAVPIVIDTEAYRARRRQQLERMALAMGERAKRERRPVTLDPMPPRDRRIIHLALKDDPLVVTRSSGSGFLRSLEIAPVEGRLERSERGGREREPIGQQGGFKHGQKRIV